MKKPLLVLPVVVLTSAALFAACGSEPESGTGDGSAGSGTGADGSGGGGGVSLGGLAGNGSGADGNSGGAAGGSAVGQTCGDGRVTGTEVCDDGNSEAGDGCNAGCDAVESGFACLQPGQPCVESTVSCGDRVVSGGEVCDDGNSVAGDGCAADCSVVEAGWICDTPGARCRAAECGDGLVAGSEQCDDGDAAAPGCSATCQLEDGFKCTTPGDECEATTCGDGIVEGTEQCDDANNDLGDGCTPACKVEPDCSAGACTSSCGDGLLLPGDDEECDDGNTLDNDGCSSACKVEEGWMCEQADDGGDTLTLPIVYRDFISQQDGLPNSHPDFHRTGDNNLNGMVEDELDDAGKPVAAVNGGGDTVASTIQSQASFRQWYRDDAAVNVTVVEGLTLTELGGQPGVFQFDSTSFFPLTGKGHEDLKNTCNGGPTENFFFTSEVRYYFEFNGGERLDFRGDDDVWVFVNGKLAVDIGGIHKAQCGFVELGPTSNPDDLVVKSARGCGNSDTEVKDSLASFGLEKGNVYEIVVFQAERNTCESNYQLTLGGFNTERSRCNAVCGDGIVTGDEVCDDGVNDGSYGSCTADCKGFGPRCGDGIVQEDDGEACDDGVNITPYDRQGTGDGCAPGCELPGNCGDGNIDALFGETCDDGGDGDCPATCSTGTFCGDGIVQAENGEQCDDGNNVSGDGCSATCQTVVIQ